MSPWDPDGGWLGLRSTPRAREETSLNRARPGYAHSLRTAEGERLSGSEPLMLSHVHVGLSNFSRSYAFYAAIFEALGLELRVYRPQESWAGWGAAGTQRPLFFIGVPFDGRPVDAGNGHMIALLASTREVVDRCHAAALAHGGRCEGPLGCDRTIMYTTMVHTCEIPTETRYVYAVMRRRHQHLVDPGR